jgi:hypothetical protein
MFNVCQGLKILEWKNDKWTKWLKVIWAKEIIVKLFNKKHHQTSRRIETLLMSKTALERANKGVLWKRFLIKHKFCKGMSFRVMMDKFYLIKEISFLKAT